MPAYVDVRPAGYDVAFRPGATLTVTLEWPAGSLGGRTFTSTLEGVALSVLVVGDTMTVEASAAQTAAVAEPAEWLLLEDGEPLIVGTWSPSDRAAVGPPEPVEVTQGAATVTVSVTSSQASIVALTATRLGVEHDWDEDGWDPFTTVVITADGAQSFTQSVSNGRGVITSTDPTAGSHRVAYLRDDTEWQDSEITSLTYSPAGYVPSPLTAQQGHIHRVREISAGLYEGVAIWTAVVGGDYVLLNTRAVRFTGSSLLQSTGDGATAADSGYIDRQLILLTKERITAFGLFFNNHAVQPAHLYGLLAGDIVTVDSLDSTFDKTDVALNAVGSGSVQVQEATTLSTSALALDSGNIRPSSTSSQKRWCPFWMSTRVRGGTSSALTVEFKRWRPEDPEPDWGGPRVQRKAVASNTDVPTLPTGAGFCALWGAHFMNGSSGSWGKVRCRKL